MYDIHLFSLGDVSLLHVCVCARLYVFYSRKSHLRTTCDVRIEKREDGRGREKIRREG